MKKIEGASYTNWRNNTLAARLETDKKYLILKMGDFLISTAGLGWYLLYTLQGIRFAIENGYIPVVDWKNCKLPQYDSAKIGKENVWEFFFEQPFNVNVETAYKSEDFFVIDDVRGFDFKNPFEVNKFVDFYNESTMKWRKYFQQYVRLKENIRKDFDKTIEQQNLKIDNIIGILARGTDYMELKPVGHLKPISINEIFMQVDEIFGNTVDNKIFIATEDRRILGEFQDKYNNKVFTVNTKRYENLGFDTLNMVYKKEDGYERDLKYLYSLYVISKCPIAIYSPCGGAIIASLMRKDIGSSYRFLYNGYNRAKGIIVGSYLERIRGEILSLGDKPIMFYALNTLKLLHIVEVDIIVSASLKEKYQKRIGFGESFGMQINYKISDTYNVIDYMIKNMEFMEVSKILLLYTDYFVHGKDVIKELTKNLNTFDGAFVWGVKNVFSNESIKVSKKYCIPEEVSTSYKSGNYSLMGRLIFDYELKDILVQSVKKNKEVTLSDILNEYIKRKKLFFIEYKRGTVYSKIEDMYILKKTDQMINLIEEIQGERIGDFEAFRIKN